MNRENGRKSVLVIGGGIAGIQASLDLANMGFKVYLVEKSPSLGGRMAQLDKTFPTNDCAMCILAPKMIEADSHPNIELLPFSEVTRVSGGVGRFNVRVRKKASYVDWNKCTGCGLCVDGCPVIIPNEFDQGIGKRRAIYMSFPQAVPKKCVIDKREERPCKTACMDACPVHANVPGYLKLIAQREFKAAYKLIRETNPFPACVGRVCFAPCQVACNRGQMDEPLCIRDLKRVPGDQWNVEELEVPVVAKTGKKVAIVGAGPTGLTAANDLALKGHSVTVFEALPEPGGILRVGVPEYRLPRKVLNQEIGYIQKLGVEIKTGVQVGRDITLEELRKGYDAICVAVGAHGGMKLGVEGEDVPGVMEGMGFFRATSLGKEVRVGKKVAVIGGGSTAIDGAPTASRPGAKVVTGPAFVIYAIAEGKKAARSIHQYLNGQPLEGEEPWKEPEKLSEEEIEDCRRRFPSKNKVKMKEEPVKERVQDVHEVALGYSPEEAAEEASRCLAGQIEGCMECYECERRCEPKAIMYTMQDTDIELKAGAIIVASGLGLYDISSLREYGYGKIKNVITAMEFERLTTASGPTMGELRRASDGRIPENVAFIQCVGSRDLKNKAYCSSVCCMHATKEAILAFEHHPGTKSTIFYMDMRAVGKRFQEYIARAKKEYNVTYIRARPGKIEVNSENNNPVIWYEETTGGEVKSFETELVILCQAMIPQIDDELAKVLGIELDAEGFVGIPDKLSQPLDTTRPGIFACGYVHSPRDIPDSVTQASGAAARAAEAITGGM